MPIYANPPKTSSFVPCPEGLHVAVCVDVIDLGIVSGAFGDRPKVRIVWQIAEETSRGQRYDARKDYNNSLHEKATLRKDLEGWRGRRFLEDELEKFDLEKLIGANCQIQVVHAAGADGTVWANVQTVVAAGRNIPKLKPAGYTRVKDRDTVNSARSTAGELGSDDIPF